jgi:hypothetical protein
MRKAPGSLSVGLGCCGPIANGLAVMRPAGILARCASLTVI